MATPSGYTPGRKENKLDVKNKNPAPIQITAEQLLREAVERQAEDVAPVKQRIVDAEELQAYRVRKRKEFEDLVRRQTHHIGTWIKYATWEAGQKEFRRARSIFERALNVDFQNVTIWQKYIEMEVQNKFVISARNLYERVCTLLPRVDQFWFKHAHMEELLGNYAGARAIYDKWMGWDPDHKAWMLYVHFENRCNEIQRARLVFERYISTKPTQVSFLRFAKFEEKLKNPKRARAGFEKAIEVLTGVEELDENFYIKFAEFETRCKNFERVKVICKEGLSRLPKGKSNVLYSKYVSFQKQHAAREEIEETVLTKRRFHYEDLLKSNPLDYDTWFDYLRLEESAGKIEACRELYERAIANVPPIKTHKRFWIRYIYLWINYALFEELVTEDYERAREVYQTALEIVPVKKFTFSKLYTLFADFEVRRLDIGKARKIYGRAIGECGKSKIFFAYANLELRLGNIDRCRRIYAKYVELYPNSSKSWVALVEVELIAEEIERAVAICELGISMEHLDTPELIWKCYIDLETSYGQPQNVRNLYERLLDRSQHYKVFLGYASFEKDEEQYAKCREVIKRGIENCKEKGLNEERAILYERWIEIEREIGDEKEIKKVFDLLPRQVKRKRPILDDDGEPQGFEEYMTYIFPADGVKGGNMSILEAAKAWKQKVAQNAQGSL